MLQSAEYRESLVWQMQAPVNESKSEHHQRKALQAKRQWHRVEPGGAVISARENRTNACRVGLNECDEL